MKKIRKMRYKSRFLPNRLSLKKQLYAFQMTEGANFIKHLDEFNRLTMELDSIRVKIKEEDKAIILLVSLSSSYEHLKTTLIFGKDTLGLDEVVAMLISHEVMKKKESGKHLEGNAMVASENDWGRGRSNDRRGRSKPRGRSQSRPCYRRKCYYCD